MQPHVRQFLGRFACSLMQTPLQTCFHTTAWGMHATLTQPLAGAFNPHATSVLTVGQ